MAKNVPKSVALGGFSAQEVRPVSEARQKVTTNLEFCAMAVVLGDLGRASISRDGIQDESGAMDAYTVRSRPQRSACALGIRETERAGGLTAKRSTASVD